MIRDIGGVLFSTGSLISKAGREFEIQVYPFDYRGKHIITNIDKPLKFGIIGNGPISVNDIEKRGRFRLDPALLINGVARIRIKAYKQGNYSISYTNGKSFYNNGIKGTWNDLSFDIIPSESVRAEHTMPDNIIAGKSFTITRILYDDYGNRTGSGQFDIRLLPFPERNSFNPFHI